MCTKIVLQLNAVWAVRALEQSVFSTLVALVPAQIV